MFSIRSFPAQPFYDGPDLQIRAIGIRETMPPSFIERPSGTEAGDYLFIVFHDPFRIGEPTRQLPGDAGCAVFWNRGQAQFYGNPQARWNHSWIHCDGTDIKDALVESGVKCGQPLPLHDPMRVERYLQNIYEDVTGDLEPDYQILRNTLVNLIREVSRSQNKPKHKPVPAYLSQSRQHIDIRYHERLDLKSLAQDAHLSVPHFCTEFRRHFGITPIAYLIQRRLEAAATLLRSTHLDVGEIGRRVGYDDIYHFSKLFKQYFSVSPKGFRNSAARLKSVLNQEEQTN